MTEGMSEEEKAIKAEKILTTLVRLWCDQHGIVPGKIVITDRKEGTGK